MKVIFPAGTPKNIKALVGIMVTESGDIADVKVGGFDLGMADDIAARLILMASAIRSAARSKIEVS